MSDQPIDQQTAGRYTVVPRTLIFLERDGHVLLLRGAEHKWFAGMYNGIGGHVEPDEGVLAAARRETVEETGLSPERLELGAIIHVIGDQPGILLFVFRGTAIGDVRPTNEGELTWVPVDRIAEYPLVPDLPWLLPRALRRRDRPFTATFHFTSDCITIETEAGERHTLPLS